MTLSPLGVEAGNGVTDEAFRRCDGRRRVRRPDIVATPIISSASSPPIVRLSRSCRVFFRSRCAAILSLLVATVISMIEIVAGNHVPDLPFVIVNREGCHVDLTGICELGTVVTSLP